MNAYTEITPPLQTCDPRGEQDDLPHVADAQEPHWLTVDAARREIGAAMSDLLALAASMPDAEDQPALALRVSAGTGKTQAALRLVAAQGKELLARGHIVFYFPSLDLADRARAEFVAFGSRLRSTVLRGRDAIDPLVGTPMCSRSEFVRQISGLVPSVKSAICEVKPRNREIIQSPCRAGCAYYSQLQSKAHQVVFTTHAYLTSPLPLSGPVALRIVDEKVHGSLTRTSRLPADAWCLGARPRSEHHATLIGACRMAVLEALWDGSPILEALRAQTCTQDDLDAFAEYEACEISELDLKPSQSPDEQSALLQSFDVAARRHALRRTAIWRLLAAAWTLPDTERLSLVCERTKSGEERQVLRLHGLKKLPRDAPLLLLDADADPAIVEAIAPGARFLQIDTRPQAEIVQICDQGFSNAALLTGSAAARHRANLRLAIEREVARAPGRVLVVATKPVLQALHQDAAPYADIATDEALLAPLHGAAARWFGPKMQGIDDYKDYATVMVIGRLQPTIEVVEAAMREVFGDSELPLDFITSATGSIGWFEPTEAAYLMADGGSRPAKLRGHPDPRGAALLGQTREASSLQAIARLRLIAPQGPKRVVIACSIPLPGLPITTLLPWADYVADRAARTTAPGADRLRKALTGPDGVTLRAGLRLSSAGLAADAPESFPTASAAKEWRRSRDTQTLTDLISEIAIEFGATPQFINLAWDGRGGALTPAVVFGEPLQVAGAVETLWPGTRIVAHQT